MEGMKHFGWGVLANDEKKAALLVYDKEETAESDADRFTHPDLKPHRVVELFYKDEQS